MYFVSLTSDRAVVFGELAAGKTRLYESTKDRLVSWYCDKTKTKAVKICLEAASRRSTASRHHITGSSVCSLVNSLTPSDALRILRGGDVIITSSLRYHHHHHQQQQQQQQQVRCCRQLVSCRWNPGMTRGDFAEKRQKGNRKLSP